MSCGSRRPANLPQPLGFQVLLSGILVNLTGCSVSPDRKDLVPMENCRILFVDEIFELERPGTQLNKNDYGSASQTPTKRESVFFSLFLVTWSSIHFWYKHNPGG